MCSIIVSKPIQQSNYHIIICVCCSLVIVCIFHILCIIYTKKNKIDETDEVFKPYSKIEPNEQITNPKKKLILKKNISNNYITIIKNCNLINTPGHNISKCNAIKRNGNPCKQNGHKSGGEIISGYCNYHQKMRK